MNLYEYGYLIESLGEGSGWTLNTDSLITRLMEKESPGLERLKKETIEKLQQEKDLTLEEAEERAEEMLSDAAYDAYRDHRQIALIAERVKELQDLI